MKVTVLRDDHKMALHRETGSGALRTERLPASRGCSVGAACILALLLGFVISQVVVAYCRNRNAQDAGSEVQVELELPSMPLGYYRNLPAYRVSNQYRELRPLWASAPENNVGDSILMAAILKMARENLMEEIRNEGFIVVESGSPKDAVTERDRSGSPLIHSFFRLFAAPSGDEDKVVPPAPHTEDKDSIGADGDISDLSLPFAQFLRYLLNTEKNAEEAVPKRVQPPPTSPADNRIDYASLMNHFDVQTMEKMNDDKDAPPAASTAPKHVQDDSLDAILSYFDVPDIVKTKQEEQESSTTSESKQTPSDTYASLMNHFKVSDLDQMGKLPTDSEPSAVTPVAREQNKMTSQIGGEVLDWLKFLEQQASDDSEDLVKDLKDSDPRS